MNKKIDFFAPPIITVIIAVFLIAGYIGSFNYRFEDPLDIEVISTIIYAIIIFLIGVAFVKYGLKYDSSYSSSISEKINKILSKKLLLGIVLLAIILQGINLILLGGIPLFDSVQQIYGEFLMYSFYLQLIFSLLNIIKKDTFSL